MLRSLAIVTLVFLLHACPSVSPVEGPEEAEETSGLLEKVGEVYRYVAEAYAEVLDSVMTSQPWKTATETLPMGVLTDTMAGTKATVQKVRTTGQGLLGFAGMYYEDHIKPITDEYITMASNTTATIWDRFSKKWDRFWSF